LWEQTASLSTGSAALSKFTLNPPRFLDLTVQLPPLPEQRRIVARIEELAGKIAEAKRLGNEASEEAAALKESAVASMISSVPSDPKRVGEIAEVKGGIQKSPNREPINYPTRYLTVAHVGRNTIDFGNPRFFEVYPKELDVLRLLAGDVLVIEGNGSADQIGRAALFRGEVDPCVHQNHVIRVRPNRKVVSPEYLNLFLNSPLGQEAVQSRSRSTSGLRTLSVGRIKEIEVRIPSLSDQEKVVSVVAVLEQKLTAVDERCRARNTALDALLPCILDKAFRGEL
jgi:type I restriction enzyme S subunit